MAVFSKFRATPSAARKLARMLQIQLRETLIRRTGMKLLIVALLLLTASSQFACKALTAGAVGAGVGAAVERERQEDKDKDRD